MIKETMEGFMLKEAIDQIASLFKTPSAEILAIRELDEAKRKLLQAQSSYEYYRCICEYNEDRIKRLSEYIAGIPKHPLQETYRESKAKT